MTARTHQMRQIHGLAGVTKCAMIDDTLKGQNVRITDDGARVLLRHENWAAAAGGRLGRAVVVHKQES